MHKAGNVILKPVIVSLDTPKFNLQKEMSDVPV